MNFFILGGDLRNVELTKLLAKEKNMVYTYGLEKAFKCNKNDKIINVTSIEQLSDCKIVITSLPLSKDGNFVNTPFSEVKIEIKDVLRYLNDKIIFTGNINDEHLEIIEKHNEVIDIMKREDFAILNAIPTAEATIKIIIENTKKIIQGSDCLIMGFGRIGKVLASKLKSLSVNVTCTAINEEEYAWIKAYGYDVVRFKDIENILDKYDVIVNTIPKIVLNEEIRKIKDETLIIDLASNPGGINKEIAKKEKKELITALGLPGKIAPITSAEYIKNIVFNVLNI